MAQRPSYPRMSLVPRRLRRTEDGRAASLSQPGARPQPHCDLLRMRTVMVMAASLPPASGLPRGEGPTGCIRHTRPELLAKLTLHRKPCLTGTAVDPLGEPWRRHINKAKKPCACLAVLPFPLLAFWMQAPQRRSQRHTASYSCCGQQYGVISKQVPTGPRLAAVCVFGGSARATEWLWPFPQQYLGWGDCHPTLPMTGADQLSLLGVF